MALKLRLTISRLDSSDEVLVLDQQFPSNIYPWLEQAKSQVQFKVRFVAA